MKKHRYKAFYIAAVFGALIHLFTNLGRMLIQQVQPAGAAILLMALLTAFAVAYCLLMPRISLFVAAWIWFWFAIGVGLFHPTAKAATSNTMMLVGFFWFIAAYALSGPMILGLIVHGVSLILRRPGPEEQRAAQPPRRSRRIAIGLVPVVALLPTIFAVIIGSASPSAHGLRRETNSIGMTMVLIPAGEFTMGSSDIHVDVMRSAKPQHRVRITRPFYLGTCEVTQEQYRRVMDTNPSHFKGTAKLPVEQVSWVMARKFCRRLSELPEEKAAGNVYRLPTEAEWEYACRAGSTSRYSFGDNDALLTDYAWCEFNADGTSHPVGQKKPNAWGLHDMHGNVSEWCADCYDDDYYGKSRSEDPVGPRGPVSGRLHVLRGGSWSNHRSDGFECAYRGFGVLDQCAKDHGFRVARSAARTRAEEPRAVTTIRTGDGYPIRAVAFSPDSATLATAHDSGAIVLWDVASGQRKCRLAGHQQLIWKLAFSPDGKWLASAGRDCTLRIWDVASASSLAVLETHSGEVLCASFSPDGKTLASGSSDGTVRIWDIERREQIAALGKSIQVDGVAFSPDGKVLASCGMGTTIRCWNVATRELAKEFDGEMGFVSAVFFTPDGKRLCANSGVGGVELWDVETTRRCGFLKGHDTRVDCFAVSRDGRFLASSSFAPEMKLWDLAYQRHIATLTGHQRPVLGAAFSPNGTLLATASMDTTVILWSVPRIAESTSAP